MRWPVDINQYPITQKFGENPDLYKKFGLIGHDGIDIGCPTGTEVVAPHSGKVIEAAFDGPGYGNYLKIENDKEGSVLAHLQVFKVNIGDQVTEGQVIALSNNTGNSTGPHLHWGYYLFPRDRGNGYAGFINQLSLLATSGNDLQECLKQHDDLVNKCNQKDAEITQLKTNQISLNQSITKLNSDISTLTTQLQGATTQIETLQPLADQVTPLTKEKDQALSDREVCLKAEDGQQAKIKDLETQLAAGKPKTFWEKIKFLLT